MATGQGTLVLDFGAAPGTNIVQTAVTGLTTIGAGSKVEIYLMGTDSTATHNTYEHALLPLDLALSCVAVTAGTGFVAQAASSQRLTGTFQARYVWAD
jgi:hypothetical protein